MRLAEQPRLVAHPQNILAPVRLAKVRVWSAVDVVAQVDAKVRLPRIVDPGVIVPIGRGREAMGRNEYPLWVQ